MEITYYTCLDNHCPKHRNVFAEGDPTHEHCARERLRLGETEDTGAPMAASPWLWVALALATAAAVAGLTLMMRAARTNRFQPPMLREEPQAQQWSAAHSEIDEKRQGHTVPPPIG